jgi:exo-1,4-beta-D-glucosaminidase
VNRPKEFEITCEGKQVKTLKMLSALILFVTVISSCAVAQAPPEKLFLYHDWSLQTSAKVPESGEAVSTASYNTKGWIPATIPSTVVAAQFKQGLLADPFIGMNLRQYPGVNYPIGSNFSHLGMPADSPYAASWWYRNEFDLPSEFAGKRVWLHFQGINYRANIYVNGKLVADSNAVIGAWRTYEFDVTSVMRSGRNVLALEIWAPVENSLAITFVDWNPASPDKNMGIFRDVYLTTSGPVTVRHPAVLSKVESPANDRAHLTVTAVVKNASDHAIKGTLKGRFDAVEFAQPIELAAGESRDVTFTPEQYKQLTVDHPRLWWPAQMGEPNLYDLELAVEIDGKVSDLSRTKFGIREITGDVIEDSPDRFKRLIKINGKNILIRGGGWTPDMMLREDPERLRDEFKYVKDMGLNTVRLEGKLESDDFFSLADEQGILVMAGWCCCDFWEQWDKWQDADLAIAKASLTDQMYRLRGHPSLVMWLNGSDNAPPAAVEQAYLKIEKDLMWPNPILSSATAKPTTVTGANGVKMTGPYEYIAPSYWMTDPNRPVTEQLCAPGGCGGAYGFNSETSMGPAVPTFESVRRMVPKEHLWPIDEYWNYHAGGGEFKTLQVFNDALNARYGSATGAEDFTFKSQAMSYEGVRAMYEAYSRNKYRSTGVIQWMLNNAWPSMIWHLYDYYLQPGGGYFGAKKALQKLNPVYGYDDNSIWLVSSQYTDAKNLKLVARVFNVDATEKFKKEITLDAAADSTAKALTLPAIDGLSTAYFLDLRVTDASGKMVGSNFYWLSTKPETLDWSKSVWWKTPTQSYADFTAINQPPKVKLNFTEKTESNSNYSTTRITLENPSKSIAFFLRLQVTRGKDGEEVLPVQWEDNYISLLPGEKRVVSASYRTSDLGKSTPTVKIHGWNVD